MLRSCSCMYLLLMLLIFCYSGRCNGCLDDERRVLQNIIGSMGYQSENPLLESYSDDCCQWEGIDCSLVNSHVIRIFFFYTREEEDQWFPDMNLFAQLKELQELHLRGNHIGRLLNPEALCELQNLQQLDLSYNEIEDEMQSCLANMSSLRILNLSKNRFLGNLSIFNNLTKIESIDVSYNLFQGLIPLSIFSNLLKLAYLDLSYNYRLEVESEFPTWHPSFQIQHLFLAGCNLNRQSNHLIPSFISTQTNLQTLDLSNNFLEGSFPTWMLRNVSSILRLRGNSFVGEFPHVYGNMTSTIAELDISCNHLHGPLPQNISVLLPNLYGFNASSNQFSVTIPPSLGELQKLEHLDLSNNNFSGNIPSGLTKNSTIWYLNLSNNSLGGDLLPKDCNMPKLRWLLLHSNVFVGNMPVCLSHSLLLLMLDVRNNSLTGNISAQMPIFPELGAVLLGRNLFREYIPWQLCQMLKLQFLDLSNNEFSGTIPSCLSNNLFWRKKFQANSWVPTDFTTKGNSYSYQGIPLTLMSGIDLSANQLTHEIPVQLGELQELHSLNLSNNQLTGDIPLSFKNLTNLESLDLSHNRLTGPIPPELVHLNFLSTFRVGFNDLSGRIPISEQFFTFSGSSYIGNPKLCGQPLECSDDGIMICQAECSDDDNDENQKAGKQEHERDEKDHHGKEWNGIIDEPLFFYSFVFASYSLGFWAVIAPLCFSRNWRRKYYNTIDAWMNGGF